MLPKMISFFFKEQSSNKSFLMNNNDSQLLSNNIVMIPLQDYNEENKEIIAKVKKNKGILLPIVLLIIAVIGLLIFIVFKVSPNQKLSSRFNTFDLSISFHISFDYGI